MFYSRQRIRVLNVVRSGFCELTRTRCEKRFLDRGYVRKDQAGTVDKVVYWDMTGPGVQDQAAKLALVKPKDRGSSPCVLCPEFREDCMVREPRTKAAFARSPKAALP